MAELGGFAEDERAIDVDEEGEFEAFNFCLAESYLCAMESEDFEAIGEIDSSLLDSVVSWLSYNEEIKKDFEDRIPNIPTGLIMTCKDRTFADAVICCHKGDLAEVFIYNGNHDIRLYLTALFYGDKVYAPLLNNIQKDPDRKAPEDFARFFNDIFFAIGEKYNSISDSNDKIEFLRKLKPFVSQIQIPQEYKDVMRIEREKVASYSWFHEMKSL